MKIRLFLKATLTLLPFCVYAQGRIKDKHTIGWAGIFTTLKFNEKWSWHTEFQCRRVNFISDPQQNLFRTGINYQPNKKLMFRLGYTNAETYPYGDYPLNAMKKKYSDNRIFEMVSFFDKLKRVDITHRFMLEQRFVGKYSSADLTEEDIHNYVNRIRYMFRVQVPLQKKVSSSNAPYLVMYDDIFIGFGKNVGENIFDQNRFGLLFGFKFNEALKLETGYLSQILELGREVDNKNVFQYNQGVVLNALVSLDMSGNKK